MLLAANFFLLLLGLLDWWDEAALLIRGFFSRVSRLRGSRVTACSLLEPWEAEGVGFMVMPSSSLCEARDVFEVLRELGLLPATRFWDLVRFRSARVPGGVCYKCEHHIFFQKCNQMQSCISSKTCCFT